MPPATSIVELGRPVRNGSALRDQHPLDSAVDNFLDKPAEKGGLEFGRSVTSAVLAESIVTLILPPPRAGDRREPAG